MMVLSPGVVFLFSMIMCLCSSCWIQLAFYATFSNLLTFAFLGDFLFTPSAMPRGSPPTSQNFPSPPPKVVTQANTRSVSVVLHSETCFHSHAREAGFVAHFYSLPIFLVLVSDVPFPFYSHRNFASRIDGGT